MALVPVTGGCARGSGSKPPAPPPAAVQLATLEPQDLKEHGDFIGELNSRQSVQLNPQVSGYLRAILVHAGEAVKGKQALFQIDASRDQALLTNYAAAQTARQASRRLAESNFQRAEKLAPSGVVSQQEFEQARSTLESARADLAAIVSQVRAQQVQVSYYRITAPYDGTLGDIPVKVGDFVTPTTPLSVLNQNSALEVYVRVPLSLAPKLTEDSEVELLDAEGKVARTSKVRFVSPTVDPATQSILVKTVFENNGDFKTSQYVRVRVVWATRSTLLVPTVAVSRLSGQYFVYVAEQHPQGGTLARQRPIQVGEIVGQSYVVLTGLKGGEQVVVSGTQKVRDGAPIQATPAEQASSNPGPKS